METLDIRNSMDISNVKIIDYIPERKKRGRVKGSFAYVTVPLSSLVALGRDVVVSRVWAEVNGLHGKKAEADRLSEIPPEIVLVDLS